MVTVPSWKYPAHRQLWVPLTRGMSGLSGIPKPSVLGMTLTTRASQYHLVLVLMLVILVVLWKLEHSRLGLIWKSIGMADNLAQSLGVNIARYKLMPSCSAVLRRSGGRSTPTSFGSSSAGVRLLDGDQHPRLQLRGRAGALRGSDRRRRLPVVAVRAFRGSPYETIFFSIAMLLTILFCPAA